MGVHQLISHRITLPTTVGWAIFNEHRAVEMRFWICSDVGFVTSVGFVCWLASSYLWLGSTIGGSASLKFLHRCDVPLSSSCMSVCVDLR